MTDSLLTSNDCEEALSRVYVCAVAAMAGYVTAEMSLDRDGVDIQVRAGKPMYPSLDIQLKATVNLGSSNEGQFSFALKKRNYDLLREETMIPRILVVMNLPKEKAEWLSLSPQQLILRRAAYWANLAGMKETENKETVSVRIGDANLFTVEGLKSLMEQARTGVIS